MSGYKKSFVTRYRDWQNMNKVIDEIAIDKYGHRFITSVGFSDNGVNINMIPTSPITESDEHEKVFTKLKEDISKKLKLDIHEHVGTNKKGYNFTIATHDIEELILNRIK